MDRERYAIVGYGFRMPGGIYTADDFWRLLSERGFVREPVAARYGRGFEPVAGESGPSRFGSGYEGLMRGDEPYLFDSRLFGMSVREAAVMDPQMRMLLTCTWEAFEQAGWDQARLRNSRTGVFVGAQMPAAGVWQPLHGPNEFTMTGTSPDMLANRISYTFNLMGPSAVQMTACSSAASAMHAAVAAIGRGDCHQAVVGSATFLGSAGISAGFARLGVCSPDGGCRSFDATANGYMRAEGVFVYLVKPLSAAEADGDRILAVIAGTAINTAGAADGATGTGPGRMITAPTQHAQATLMRAACDWAGLLPREVDYIEAHATGTRVGDRIEGNAIGEVFGELDRTVPLRVASVKSNVGHMEAAAFGCALLKVLLMFERRAYAPVSRHFVVPNPEIDFTGLRVQTETEPFGEDPAVVGINSFGFGGANAHCLLTEYRPHRPPAFSAPAYSAPAAPDAAYLVPLSARSPKALRATARALAGLIGAAPEDSAPPAAPPSAGIPELDLYTLAGNLSTRRTHFATRTAFAATGLGDLAAQLDAFAGGDGEGDGEDDGNAAARAPVPVSTLAEGMGEPRILMVFAGQGTQWAGCAHELYASEPVFREVVDEVDAAWHEHAGFSLRDESFGAPQDRLDECQLAQPAIFMIEVALTELLRSWGVRPACVAGHSAGEVAAAYAAGIYTLAEATRLIYHRAAQQQRTAGSGRMLAIGLDPAGTGEILRELAAAAPSLEIACENAPASTVACGSASDVALAVELLEQRGIQHRLLRGNVAFHSRAMDPIEADLRACLAFLNSSPMKSAVPFVSSVTGEVTESLDAAYWWSNVRRPVRFSAAIATAVRDFRPDVVLEVSPHPALLPSVRQCLDGAAAPACVPTLARGADSRMSFCRALGALYREGVNFNFAVRYPRVRPVSHLLPPHPKDQRRLMDPMADEKQFLGRGEYSAGPLVGRRLPAGQPRFEVRMSSGDFPWLAEHRVQHTPIMPAAGYIEMILQALGGVPAQFEVVEFLKPCLLGKEPVRLQTELTAEPGEGDEYAFRICSQPYAGDGDRVDAARSVLHCTGRVRRLPAEPAAPGLADLGLSRFAAGPLRSREAFYGHMDASLGDYFQYGPRFQVVRGVRQDLWSREYLLDISLDDELWRDGHRAGYLFPPALLDGGLQAFLCYLMECSDVSAVPRRFEGLTIGRLPASARLVCHAVPPGAMPYDMGQPSMPLGEQAGGSMTLYDAATGVRVAHLERYVSMQANPKLDLASRSRYVVRWQPKFVTATVLDGDRAVDPCEPGALIGALQARGEATGRERGEAVGGAPRMCRVAEFTQGANPESIALADYLKRDRGGTSELWLLGASGSQTRRLSQAFGPGGDAVRFATADLSDPAAVDLGHGLLRTASCDLVIADARTTELTADAWAVVRQLLVPGGLALIRNASPECVPAGDGWSRLATGEQGALWAAPPDLLAYESGQPGAPGQAAGPEGPRWLIAGADHLADLPAWWMVPTAARVDMGALDSQWPWSMQAQEEMRELRAIDFFCDEPDDDPLGERLVARFLEFMRALLAAREGLACVPCRVTVVTRQGAMDVSAPRAATVWGAVRALAHELGSGLRVDLRLVDIAGPQDLQTLRWLACHDVRERELAVREGRLYAPRLLRQPDSGGTVRASAGHPYQLQVTSPGQLTGLTMRTRELKPPGPGQVEVDVAATALNFRDVMVALDLLPLASYERSSLGRQLGMEASGTVSRTGAGVTGFRRGDPVVVMTGGCVASQVTVDQRWVYPKPGALSMVEAAALPTVYVTAYHALADLARLRAGQRVLIHSAMGGVGQAAIGIARHLGAEVYATAGTAAKRERLRELDVAAVFDSRSYRWHKELMASTGGEGVDVVLNSLAGHHIALCLRALRPGGWHCEIGKVDIYADTALGLSVFRKNLRFAAIDVDRLKHDDPDRAAELAQAALRLVADGVVPPPPVTAFGFGEYESALRLMASGQHEGKVVLMAPPAQQTRGAAGAAGVADFGVIDRRPFLDQEAAYLVTGGLGGVGLRLVAYLAWAGARHLVLLDRDPARRRDAAWVRQASGIAHFLPDAGVQIDVVPADVARLADVDRVVAGLTRPLKGVFHLAAVLDDHPLADVSPESVTAVFAPKAGGAWNLHLATEDAALDHFVLVSSVASVVGNAGQSVYAAANAYLDGLAAYRKSRGLPGLAYNMAAVTEAGMAARNPHMLRLVRAMGLPPISAAQAIAHLDHALRAMPDRAHLVGAEIIALQGTADDPDYMRTGRWMASDGTVTDDGLAGLSTEAVIGELRRQITVLSGNEQVGPQDTIASFGVNSVSIAELSAFIRTRFNHHVGILELMTTATPESIASAIVAGRTAQASGHDLRTGEGRGAGPDRSEESRPAPAADASLPDQCRQDLELLQKTIRDLVGGGSDGEPVPADRFAAVFLTGATGFVGRFVLAELLRQAPSLAVHCLVRADSAEHGMDRIRDALRAAEIWDEDFAGRIRVWPGDVREPWLGLPESDFARLAGDIDAIYHLAADLNLISSYAAVREANTRSVRNVLELALMRRRKHVVYASTMGVFPQYFCNFGADFAGLRIEDGAAPDIGLMKSVLPPGLIGYPWSKLVVERALEFGRALGLPVAIMRLPQMGIAAATGYTQSTDIKIRLVMAIADAGVAPAGFRPHYTEPVDTVSETMVRISLNPERRHSVYHLVNPVTYDHGVALTEFGLDVREASYPEFRLACKARGTRSPLHGYWPLVDHFADVWFPAVPAPAQPPVAVTAVEEDVREGAAAVGAVGSPTWPGLITTAGRSLGWVLGHPAHWPYERPAVSLDAAALRRQAARYADRHQVPFEDAYPGELFSGLDRLVAALRSPSARIRADRHPAISFELARKLRNRASLAAELSRHPQIAEEPVRRPVFILGINRTGTTLLHRLLAQGDRFWAPYPEEVTHPAFPVGQPAGARRAYAEDLLTASGIEAATRGMHAVDPGEPEEEFAVLEESFAAWTYLMRYRVPDYARWLGSRDPGGAGGRPAGFAYHVHRQTMRHLSWQRGTRLGVARRSWLLKMPFHLAELGILARAYPDAVFIQTHRSPLEFMPSWLSLAESLRALSADGQDKAELGAEQLEFMSRMLTGAARLRASDPDLDQRFFDVSYLDLVADPVAAAEEIYRHFGWTFDDQTRERMGHWHARQAARRKAERRHRYSLAGYGLTEGQVEDAFSGYTEFALANKQGHRRPASDRRR